MKSLKKLIISTLVVVLFSFIWQSCSKEFPEDAFDDMNHNVASAVARLNLSLADVIEVGDSLLFQDEDGLLRFIYRNDSVYSFNVNDVLKLPDQDAFTEKFLLGDILLNNFGPIDRSIILDSIVQTIDPATAASIIAMDGTVSDMPGMNMAAAQTYDLGSVNDFMFVSFSQGYLIVTLTNHLPVTFSQLTLSPITWYGTNSFDLGTLVFQNLLPGIPQTDSIDLTGKTVWKNFRVRIDDFQSLPQTGVLVDLSQGIDVSVYSSQVKVTSGVAYLPQQLFGSGTQSVEFKVDEEEKIHQIALTQGVIHYNVATSINCDLLVKLILPTLLINGQPATHFFAIGANSNSQGDFDISNGLLTFENGVVPPYNSFPVSYEVSLLNQGSMIEFDQSDSIRLECMLSSLHFSLATGEIGEKTLAIDPFIFDLELSELEKVMGSFELTNPEIRFIVSNSIGIPVSADIQLKGKSKQGTEASLDIQNLVLPYPNLVGSEVVNQALIINNNSAPVTNFMSILPSWFELSGTATTNPGQLPQMENFVTDQGYAKIGIEFDLPFQLRTSGLTFEDTASFSLTEDAIDNALSATVFLIVDNGFPFDGFFNGYLLDSITGIAVDSIIAQPLEAAPVDAQGRVSSPKRSITSIDYTKERFEKLKQCNQLVFRVKLATTGGGSQAVSIYSDYTIGLKISIKAQYNTSN